MNENKMGFPIAIYFGCDAIMLNKDTQQIHYDIHSYLLLCVLLYLLSD